MEHPVQALATIDTLLVTACQTRLACFDLSTSTEVSTANAHKSLIRLLATYTDAASGRYVISTGEDKLLVVSRLPSLEVVSERELVKRANALEITRDGEIVVGDKFGDVYSFPLHPPPSAAPSQAQPEQAAKKDQPEYLPILGHVSMLNALALVDQDRYIATGDRDEHVRISRFPLGHVIEGFLWGSKHFVSSLLYIPAPLPATDSSASTTTGPLLLSAGGDPTIQIFKLNLASPGLAAGPVGELVGQYDIEKLLLPYVTVAPVLPDPVPAGRKKDKKGKNKTKDSDRGGAQEGDADADAANDVPVEQVEVDDEEGKKGLKTGLAVIKMVHVAGKTGDRAEGGILVSAAGCTALLYIPFTSLLSPSASTQHSLIEFPAPVLDFAPLPVPVASTSAVELLVSLDTTRSAPTVDSTTTTPASPERLVRVSLNGSTERLELVASTAPDATATADRVVLASTAALIERQPDVSSLYPVLMMLHHPGDESDLLEAGGGSTGAGGGGVDNVGDGKPKGGVRAHASSTSRKRTSSERLDADGDQGVVDDRSRKNGKRAVGRAETLRRWEEAKRKLEGGQGVESLSKGEKDAKDEMELEQEQHETEKDAAPK